MNRMEALQDQHYLSEHIPVAVFVCVSVCESVCFFNMWVIVCVVPKICAFLLRDY